MFQTNYRIIHDRGKVILPGFMASANAFMDNIGFVEFINDAVRWDPLQWKVSPGVLLKAVILNTFTNSRAPLYKIAQSYKDIDTEHLFGKGIKAEHLTSSAIGIALERVYEANAGKLFKTLSLIVFQKYDLPINRLHSDTTSISFFGDYEYEEYPDMKPDQIKEKLRITYGHNKDHRPDCKQAVLGQITNEAGIPLCCHPMDGNTSDVTWNKEALKFAKNIQNELEAGDAIYVADCKLMTKGLFLSMTEDELFFLSRVPASFDSKLQARIREEAYNDGNWKDIGKISNEKKACTYEIQHYIKDVYGKPTRLIVVKSSASLAAFEASQEKKKTNIENAIKKLSKNVFACKDDAQQEWEKFCKKYRKAPYVFSMDLVELRTEKRPRGNPGKNPKPPKVIIEWALKIEAKVDEQAMELLRQKAESFVLISNVPEKVSTPEQLLKEYKGQIVVELNFKAIKSPVLLSATLLEKEERIEAMMMLIGVSLLVRALMLYLLRKGFEESGENPRIGYSGTVLENVTMGLFQFAMDSVTIERQDDGSYNIYIAPKEELRVTTFLSYLDLDFSDLI